MLISIQYSMRMSSPSFMAPTATMEAGHRSRSSKIQGRRRSRDTIQPATAQKNCGEVEMRMSGRRWNMAAMPPVTMKET